MQENSLTKLVPTLMREVADKIEAGTCEISEEEASDIIGAICHQPLSTEEACAFLNMNRNKFNRKVREGKLPKGRKKRGFTELVYYKDALIKFMHKVLPH